MEWSEVTSAKVENRHELVLSGDKYSEKIQDTGLDSAIFSLTCLNYLSITETCLESITVDISNLSNLTTLVLHSNQLIEIPPSIGKLSKLKMLDFSRNKLCGLPSEISELAQLTSLNLASNYLTTLPSFEFNVKLGHLDVSLNRLETFPEVCFEQLVALSEIDLNGNQIKEVPTSIAVLGSLKILNLGNNFLTVIPAELADPPKLRELILKGNKLADKRLFKLVDQCHYKQVLDYIRQHCPRSSQPTSSNGKGKKGKKNRKGERSNLNIEQIDNLCHKIKVLHMLESTRSVKLMDNVKGVRGHIVCCIIKDVKFTEDTLRKYIQIQTKLHDGVCEKRNASTIATHDLAKLPPGPVTYTAMPPEKICICPLMRSKDVTGAELFAQLQNEAEAYRKEKKRNSYSGVHRYLYLLEGKPLYPCLLDSEGKVISMPPITNSDATKLSVSTTDIFIEVTSATSQGCCKTAMEALLEETLLLGIGSNSKEGNEDATHFQSLTAQQVKIVDFEGQLKNVFPSRADLNFDSKKICVVRE